MSETTANIINRQQNKAGSYDTGTTKSLFGLREEESVDMGVADGALSLLLEMLSDVSSNRGAYVLREAYSNAYDATKATGDMTRPISITIPDDDNFEDNLTTKYYNLKPNDGGACPIVTIEDNGIGMSEDDVRHYFLQYGGSKKRNTVDAIGSKGLGSKAPLAITDTFEVRTRQNGVETRATINRTESKNTARIITRNTDEPDGTTVLIPVMDEMTLSQMRDCAKTLAMHNVDANLIVNGHKTRHITDVKGVRHIGNITIGKDEDGKDVTFDLYWSLSEIGKENDNATAIFTTSQSLRDEVQSYIPTDVCYSNINVVIGGYPYNLTNASGRSYYGSRRGYYYIIGDPGYLNFTPSRDEIKIDKASEGFYNATADTIHDYDYSGYMTRVFENVPPHIAISLVEEAGGVRVTDDKSGVRLSYTKNMYNNVTIPLTTLTRDGHCLLNYARNNPLYKGDTYYGKKSYRVISDADNMLVVSRRRINKSKCSWHVNGRGRHGTVERSTTRYALAKDYAVEDATSHHLADWDVLFMDSDAPLVNYAGKNHTNVIITGYNLADTSWLMGKFSNIAHVIDGARADFADHVIRLFCVMEDKPVFDSVAEDIISVTGSVTRIGWDELRDKVKADIRERNAERRAERNNNFVHGDCHIISIGEYGRTTSDIADFISSRSSRTDNIVTKGVGELTDEEIATSIFVLTEDSMCLTKSFVAGLAVVKDDGNDIDADNVILLIAPDTRDVRYLESRGARFAFDVRKGGKYHPQTIADENGKIGGVKFIPEYRQSVSGRGKFMGAKLTVNRGSILDGYDTDVTRWGKVRSDMVIEDIKSHVPYYARQTIRSIGALLGNDQTIIGRVVHGLVSQYDCSSLAGMDADDFADYCTLANVLYFDDADNVLHEDGLVLHLKDVTDMLEKSGLDRILVEGYNQSRNIWEYDEDTLNVIRDTVTRRIMAVDAGLITTDSEPKLRLVI